MKKMLALSLGLSFLASVLIAGTVFVDAGSAFEPSQQNAPKKGNKNTNTNNSNRENSNVPSKDKRKKPGT